MTTWRVDDVLDAAVHALVNERCRRAYMHDMRGSLQAVSTSVEVLARSARTQLKDNTLIDKASGMVKRAMAQHELALTDIFDQLTGCDDDAATVNLPDMVRQAHRFLRNEALSRGVTLRLSGIENALIHTQSNKLRCLILGLIGVAIDALPAGEELHMETSRSDAYARLEVRSAASYGSIQDPGDLLCRSSAALAPQELILGFMRQWIVTNGGRFDIHATACAQTVLHIDYPLATT